LITGRERREHRVFRLLLQMVPGLEERLMEGSEEDLIHVAEMVKLHIVMHTTTEIINYLDTKGCLKCSV
jgi:hypothetical protein